MARGDGNIFGLADYIQYLCRCAKARNMSLLRVNALALSKEVAEYYGVDNYSFAVLNEIERLVYGSA